MIVLRATPYSAGHLDPWPLATIWRYHQHGADWFRPARVTVQVPVKVPHPDFAWVTETKISERSYRPDAGPLRQCLYWSRLAWSGLHIAVAALIYVTIWMTQTHPAGAAVRRADRAAGVVAVIGFGIGGAIWHTSLTS